MTTYDKQEISQVLTNLNNISHFELTDFCMLIHLKNGGTIQIEAERDCDVLYSMHKSE